MEESINRFIYLRQRQIEEAKAFEDILPRCRAAMSDLGEEDECGVSGDVCTGAPKVTLSMTVLDRGRLMTILSTFARHGLRRKQAEGFMVHESRTSIYELTDGVTLHIAMMGENCKLVEVGTKPVYELVCS